MNELRSLLYVPAHRSEWVADVPSSGADGVILDLEDSVPAEDKAVARDVLLENADRLADAEATVTVRYNPAGTGQFHDDVVALVRPWVDAVVLPKVEAAEDVDRAEALLEHEEHRQGIDEPVEIVPLLESPAGVHRTRSVCAASDRVTAVGGSTSRGGDMHHSLGFEWTPEGTETLYVRSKLLHDARAAGVEQVISGVWSTLDDEDGLREKADRQRRLGYTGMQAVHPRQVEAINDAFTPDAEAVERSRELLDAYERSGSGEQGAIEFEGQMVDAAQVKRARTVLRRAEAFDVQAE